MSSTARSKARYRRAALVMAPLPLDSEQRAALEMLCADRKCSAAALVRALLLDAASRLGSDPVDEAGSGVDAG
jgi:hypothetical protein